MVSLHSCRCRLGNQLNDVAECGSIGHDQWNFFMSPVAASQDASGEYTKKWCPELSKLPNAVLHKPWEAPAQLLQAAGVVLGETYPTRIISDLKAERSKSVEAVLKMRRANQESNSDRGYDMITLPDGKRTVVFTKKEFRIDPQGNVVKEAAQRKKVERWYQHSRVGKGQARQKALQKEPLSMARGSSEEVVKVRFDVSQMHREHIRLRSCSWGAGKMK